MLNLVFSKLSTVHYGQYCSKNIGPDGLSDATLQILLCVFTEKRLLPGNLYKKSHRCHSFKNKLILP